MTLPFYISRHAAMRIQDMLIPPHEIPKALFKPDSIQPTRHPERKLHIRGDIALVYHETTKTIITVLWATCGANARVEKVWTKGGWIDY